MSKATVKLDPRMAERRSKQLTDAGIKVSSWLLAHPEAQELCDRLKAIRSSYDRYAEELPSREVKRRLAKWSAQIEGERAKLSAIANSRTAAPVIDET